MSIDINPETDQAEDPDQVPGEAAGNGSQQGDLWAAADHEIEGAATDSGSRRGQRGILDRLRGTPTRPGAPDSAATFEQTWGDPRKPSALLIPQTARQRNQAAQATRSGLVFLAVTAAVVVGAGALTHVRATHAAAQVAKARNDLTVATMRYTSASGDTALSNALSDREKQLASLLTDAVNDQALSAAVTGAAPSGVHITGYSTDQSAACQNPNPWSLPGATAAQPAAGGTAAATATPIGCLTISGNTNSRPQVTHYLTALQQAATASGTLYGPYLQSAVTGDKGEITFTIQVSYTAKARSTRFASLLSLTDQATTTTTTTTTTAPGSAASPSASTLPTPASTPASAPTSTSPSTSGAAQ